MSMDSASVVDMGSPDQILGPPRRCNSDAMSVAISRAIMEGQIGLPPRWLWNAISRGHCLNFFAAWYREARAVAPRIPLSLSIWVHELVAVEQ